MDSNEVGPLVKRAVIRWVLLALPFDAAMGGFAAFAWPAPFFPVPPLTPWEFGILIAVLLAGIGYPYMDWFVRHVVTPSAPDAIEIKQKGFRAVRTSRPTDPGRETDSEIPYAHLIAIDVATYLRPWGMARFQRASGGVASAATGSVALTPANANNLRTAYESWKRVSTAPALP